MNKFERVMYKVVILLLLVFGVIAASKLIMVHIPDRTSVKTAVSIPTVTSTAMPTSVPTSTPPSYHMIVYKVAGPSFVSVTYRNQGGDTAQQESVPSQWNYTFTATPGQFLYISVQNTGWSGAVQCEIWVDGVLVKQTESYGDYVIATCSGRL